MYISPNVDSNPDLLEMVLSDHELLAEFAQYLNEIDVYFLLQFYVTVDSFGSDEFKLDLDIVLDFIKNEIVCTLLSNIDCEIVNEINELKTKTSFTDFDYTVFKRLKKSIIKIFKCFFWDGFKNTIYHENCIKKISISNIPITNDLFGVKATLTDATNDFSSKKIFKNQTFLVSLENQSKSTGYIKPIKYTDFQVLNDKLSVLFPKVLKISFPKNHAIETKSKRDKLVLELQHYLNVLLSDESITRSDILIDFLAPINGDTEPVSNIQNRMFGAIKSYGNVLNKGSRGVLDIASGVVGGAGQGVVGIANGIAGIFDVLEKNSFEIDVSEHKTESSLDQKTDLKLDTKLDAKQETQKQDSKPQTANSATPETDTSPPISIPNRNSSLEEFITRQELEIILECIFGAIEETFNLSDPDQWIRQRGLHVK